MDIQIPFSDLRKYNFQKIIILINIENMKY